jgi:predicted N-formylglutamate amidohydrolase
MHLLLTCEHGGNRIPKRYAPLFGKAQKELAGHRGSDLGALHLYRSLQPLAQYSCASTTSRLLVELNRSLHHPQLFSAHSRALSQSARAELLDAYYHPYREQVERVISDWLDQQKELIHIAVHTFTPELYGEVRNADIGLLYDPSRAKERRFAARWAESLRQEASGIRVRMNYPYLGKSDGLPTALRKKFTAGYSGIELEVNQCWATQGRMPAALRRTLSISLQRTLSASR